ncbi:DUF645 family protein, partial [Vibrio vulnificus]|nr:DUF645 family protein [Vibrio vulnificus]
SQLLALDVCLLDVFA